MSAIQKINRQRVLELNEVASCFNDIQDKVDQADAGLNPLGIARDAVPFDINPVMLDPQLPGPKRTHFEQIHDRAMKALKNAVAVFDHANQSTQMLRRQQDELSSYGNNIANQEAALKNELIEVFGSPYPDDIGPTGTYPINYNGPDIYHFMYTEEYPGEEGLSILSKPADVDWWWVIDGYAAIHNVSLN